MITTLPNPRLSNATPVEAKQIQVPKPVDENGFYRVHVQLGTNTSWLNFRGVRNWQRRLGQEPGSPSLFDPKYVVVEAVRSGEEINGLISETKRWMQANQKDMKPEGNINRMFAVIGIEPLPDFLPDTFTNIGGVGGLSLEMLKLLIVSEGRKLFKEMLTELGLTK